MNRTSNTFSILQATAATVGLAILLWSIGLPSIRFAEAANVTSFSNTLSVSEPSEESNHTISFVTPTGLTAGEAITITFPAGFTGIDSLVADDLDLAVNGVDEDLIDGAASGGDWQVNAAGQVIDILSGSDAVGAGATVTIEIGTNAWFTASGTNQITNPATANPYEIQVQFGDDTVTDDSGTTIVVILDTVRVSASVDTVFTFEVTGVNASTSVNTEDVVRGTSTATTVPFGVLTAENASTSAQTLTVTTNAANGFAVTVETNQQLTSANGAIIDGLADGAFDETPAPWPQPGATPGQENEYGHWGLSSSDPSVNEDLSNFFNNGDSFVSASTTPVEVFRHDGPTNGSTNGIGTANVIYKVEITALQEAGDDYNATLTYVATPVF